MASPPPSTSNQYFVFTSYSGPDAPSVTQTWLMPPAYAYSAATPSTPLNLPFLWTGAGSVPAIAYSNDDFVLAANSGGGSPTKGNVVVTLQLTGKNAWNTQPASRATFRANFLSFLANVEKTLELGSPALLVPGSTALIASSLTQYMPLPLSEVLLYACGLETGIGTGSPAAIDLSPGMRLRSEPSVRQYLAPPNQALSGYVAAGSLAWTMSTNVTTGAAVQTFDPFLGSIAAPQVVPLGSPPVPLYGLTDLQQAGAAFKYYRLIFPQNVNAGGAPGSSGVTNNVQLTGANTLADLRANPAFTGWFFGRDILVPEIAVWLQLAANTNPQMVYVPVGTTVSNMLERFTRWLPLAPNQGVVVLQRLAITGPQGGTRGAQFYYGVIFSQQIAQPNTMVNDLGAFALPLLPGDYLTITLGRS